MPTSRVAPAAVTINNRLYVVGGFTDLAGVYPVLEVYDPVLNNWATLSPMPTARGRLAAGVINGTMYAVGGAGGETAVEAYDPSTNTWTQRAPVNRGRLGAAAGVIGNKLYVVGGTANDSLQTLEEYDPVANTWVFKAPMPTPRYLLAAVVIGSKLYAVGGTNSITGGSALGTLEVYSPETDTWQTKASMPTPRSDLAAAVVDGKMYVVGGYGAPNVGVVLEVYDPVLDAWTGLNPMPTSRGDLAASAVDAKLFAVGGTSAPGAMPLATLEFYAPPLPVITSPLAVTSMVGVPFTYQLAASGETSLGVSNLPPGLTFNASLSAIIGIPTTAGISQVGLSAANSQGTTNATLTVTVQPVPSSGPVIISSSAATGRVGQQFLFRVFTSGGTPAATLSASGLPPGLVIDAVPGVTGLISGTPTTEGSFAVTLTVTDGPVTTTSTLQLTFSVDAGRPVITSPSSAVVTPNVPFTYTIVAPSSDPDDPVSFSYFGNLPTGLTFDAATGTISGIHNPLMGGSSGADKLATGRARPPGGPELAGGILLGAIQLFATNGHGTSTFPLVFLGPSPGVVNISTRLQVETGDDVLIGGFIIQGNAPKVVVIRAIGPSTGIPSALQDTTLELHASGGNVVSNDNWRDTQQDLINATGIPPADDRESAILIGLDPGNYTAIVAGKNGTTGIALVEAYDLGTASLDISGVAKLANISTRGFVNTDDNVMIGGFIVRAEARRVVARAIGPSLTAAGVPGALQDTVLELRDGTGTLLFSNDDWRSTQEQEIIATGLAPIDDRESAIVANLGPANYTAIVSGKNNTTGVGLVEVYVLP